MSQHMMRVQIDHENNLDESGDSDWNILVDIWFTFTKGEKPVLYGDYPDPGWGPEIEFMEAELVMTSGKTLTTEEINQAAEDYLYSDQGREMAIDAAASDECNYE